MEALDHTLQDICNNDRLFGGITVILGGDFLQTQLIVPQGLRVDIVDATILRSYLWEHAKNLSLQQNMRLKQGGQDTQEFARWLLDIGHGHNIINENKIQFPEHMQVGSADLLIKSIYPAINSIPPPPPEYFLNCMILAP